MPWKTVERDCEQSDGTKGTHAVVKEKPDGSTEQVSCHTSSEKARASIRAKHASNEGKTIQVSKSRIREIIREELAKTFGGTHPDEAYVLGTKKNLMLDRESQHGGWPEGEYDPPVNKRIYDYLKSLGMIQ